MKTIKILSIILSLFFSVVVAASGVNINTASKQELMSLKGIGEARAEAIMKYRKKQKFKTKDDLKNVPGIGDEIYRNNSRYIKVTGLNELKAEEAAGESLEKTDKTKAKAKSGKTKSKQQ